MSLVEESLHVMNLPKKNKKKFVFQDKKKLIIKSVHLPTTKLIGLIKKPKKRKLPGFTVSP
jgi:hypothetical protein